MTIKVRNAVDFWSAGSKRAKLRWNPANNAPTGKLEVVVLNSAGADVVVMQFDGSGLVYESAADNIAAAGANQGAATLLTTEFNRITTATANQGVKLPVSVAGADVYVLNHSGQPITVYGSGTDTVDDVATATGVNQMNRSVVLYTCYTAGAWYSNGLATGYAVNPQGSTVLETIQFADAVAAAGASQAAATQLVAGINTVSTVGAGAGVNLPASSAGLQVTVINTGVSPLLVYPAQGASDTINGVAATVGVVILPGTNATFNCTAAGAWNVMPGSTTLVSTGTNAATAGTTLTAANVTGASGIVVLNMTGALGAGANAQLPTVAAMLAAMHAPATGTSFLLRIMNTSSGAFAWTVTTNTGWTLAGTMTIAQNTYKDFIVQVTSAGSATAKITSVGQVAVTAV